VRGSTCAWHRRTGGSSRSARALGDCRRRPTSRSWCVPTCALPKAEYLALKQSVLELTAVGRNLNQIARAMNQGGRPALPGRVEVGAMLKVAEGLRDHFKGLLKANERSWRDHAEASD
jgi:hypothetical protein